MESEKFPDANIKGTIENFSTLDFTQDFEITINTVVDLTMHGVTQQRVIPIKIKSITGLITISSNFRVNLQDHKIERPKLLFQKIAETIDVSVSYQLLPYKK